MLEKIFALFGYAPTMPEPVAIPIKRIAFMDGDQPMAGLVSAYNQYIANTNTETHIVRLSNGGATPKNLKNFTGDGHVNKVFLDGFKTGKEVVDKFIGAYIQRAISEGYTHISVISSDYDFIDIFKMAVKIDENAKNVSFHMIVPNPMGSIRSAPNKIANITITKMGMDGVPAAPIKKNRKPKAKAVVSVPPVQMQRPATFKPPVMCSHYMPVVGGVV